MRRSPPQHTGAECAGGSWPPAEWECHRGVSGGPRTPRRARGAPGMFYLLTYLLGSVHLPELPHDINDQAQRPKAMHEITLTSRMAHSTCTSHFVAQGPARDTAAFGVSPRRKSSKLRKANAHDPRPIKGRGRNSFWIHILSPPPEFEFSDGKMVRPQYRRSAPVHSGLHIAHGVRQNARGARSRHRSSPLLEITRYSALQSSSFFGGVLPFGPLNSSHEMKPSLSLSSFSMRPSGSAIMSGLRF